MKNQGLRDHLTTTRAIVARRSGHERLAAWARATAALSAASAAVDALAKVKDCERQAAKEIAEVSSALGLASRELAEVRPFFSVTPDLAAQLADAERRLAHQLAQETA